MKAGGGAFVVIFGRMALWVAASGKLSCFKVFGDCMASADTFGTGQPGAGQPDTGNSGGGSFLTAISDFFSSGGGGNTGGTPPVGGDGQGNLPSGDPGGDPGSGTLGQTQSRQRYTGRNFRSAVA